MSVKIRESFSQYSLLHRLYGLNEASLDHQSWWKSLCWLQTLVFHLYFFIGPFIMLAESYNLNVFIPTAILKSFSGWCHSFRFWLYFNFPSRVFPFIKLKITLSLQRVSVQNILFYNSLPSFLFPVLPPLNLVLYRSSQKLQLKGLKFYFIFGGFFRIIKILCISCICILCFMLFLTLLNIDLLNQICNF